MWRRSAGFRQTSAARGRIIQRIGVCFLFGTLAACSGGSSSSNGAGSSCAQLAGSWSVRESIAAGACFDSGATKYSYTPTFAITQSGCNITIKASDGDQSVYSGVAGVSSLRVSGTISDPDTGDQYQITGSNITVGADSFSGTVRWTYPDGGTDCAGTLTLTAVKQAASPATSGTSSGSGGSSGGGTQTAPLNFYEQAAVGLYSFYNGYDGSTDYYRFDADRTGCHWSEPGGSEQRTHQGAYAHWRLDVDNPVGTHAYTMLVIQTSSEYSIGEYHYDEDEFWEGGYSNLNATRSNEGKTCP